MFGRLLPTLNASASGPVLSAATSMEDRTMHLPAARRDERLQRGRVEEARADLRNVEPGRVDGLGVRVAPGPPVLGRLVRRYLGVPQVLRLVPGLLVPLVGLADVVVAGGARTPVLVGRVLGPVFGHVLLSPVPVALGAPPRHRSVSSCAGRPATAAARGLAPSALRSFSRVRAPRGAFRSVSHPRGSPAHSASPFYPDRYATLQRRRAAPPSPRTAAAPRSRSRSQ